MENENTQTTVTEDLTTEAAQQNAETTTAEDAPKPTGKGKLWAEIGMGIVGIIASFILFGFLGYIMTILGNLAQFSIFTFFLFECTFTFLYFLLATICVAEGVRFAGKRTGGHKKRKGCYIGAAICALIAIISICIYGYMWHSRSLPRYDHSVSIFLFGVLTLLIFAGAIIGYRKNAA